MPGRKWISARRKPTASLRRSPTRHNSSTSSRSRAERHARSTAIGSWSLARSTRVVGTFTRWRARSRSRHAPSSPRASAGRLRLSASSYSSRSTSAGASPWSTANARNPRTAASTALIRFGPRAGALPGPASRIAPALASPRAGVCRSQRMNAAIRSAAVRQSAPTAAHHRRYNAIEVA